MRQQAEAILADWRSWAATLPEPPQVLDELPGGRTNHSYLIRLGDESAVLRLNAANSEALGINRHREQALHRLAAAAGLAPRLLVCDAAFRFVITEYVDGRQWTRQDLVPVRGRQRIRDLIAEVQALPVTFPRFDYPAYIENYWLLLSQQRPEMLRSLRERHEAVMSEVRALHRAPWQPVVAHHDLNPENLIERAGRLYLLDWEYAGCGHPEIDRLLIDADRVDPRLRVLSGWMNHLWELLHEDGGSPP